MSIDDFIDNEIEKLPPLNDTIIELKEAYKNENSTAQDFKKIIQKDPILVADILKIANSPYYGFSSEIHDLRHAIMLFGFDEIINFAIFSTMDQYFDIDLKPYGIDEKQFLKFSLLKSKIASKFFQKEKSKSILINNLAFLSDVGKVILAKFAKLKDIIIVDRGDSLINIDKLEQNFFGLDTIDISYKIFDKWNFDANFLSVLKLSKRCSKKDISNILYGIRSIVTIYGEIIEPKEEIECLEKKGFSRVINV